MKNTAATLFTLLGFFSLAITPLSARPVVISDNPVAFIGHAASFQLDPDDRNYVLDTFSINENSLDVLVTKTASGRYQAFKEYWRTNQDMLAAIEDAAVGTTMALRGTSYSGAAPTDFVDAMRMQATVSWSAAEAPEKLSWAYIDRNNNSYICIEFNLSGASGERKISSIRWYLAAPAAPRSGTYVFHDGTKYSLIYRKAPELPAGYSWYGVTVYPGS